MPFTCVHPVFLFLFLITVCPVLLLYHREHKFYFHQLDHRQAALTVSLRLVGHTDHHLNWHESTLTSRSHTEHRLLCQQAQPEPRLQGRPGCFSGEKGPLLRAFSGPLSCAISRTGAWRSHLFLLLGFLASPWSSPFSELPYSWTRVLVRYYKLLSPSLQIAHS